MKNSDLNVSPSAARLAIIGIGCLFPKADNKEAYWTNIAEGIDAISEVPETHWPVDEYYDADKTSPDRTYGRRGGFLSAVDFNPMEYNIPPNVLEAIDTSQLLGLVAAGQALKDAGYGPDRSFDRSKASVILGVTGTLELVIPLGARLGHPIWRKALKDAGVDPAVANDVVERISDSYVPWQENSFPGLLGNVVAGRISKQYDLGGTNCVVDAACASSFSAMHLATMELASGKSDIVVTGGVDTFNDIFMYMCFSKTPALSPTGNAKPFDTSADGTILGEGLGLVVLKRLEDAERDGDRIYAVIRGVGSSSDGKGDAIYAPSSAGQKKALLNAYRNADVTPESIGLLEAHGTGTKVGDAVEISALREVYGNAERPWCCLGSVKSQIGHTKAAAGAAGLIKAALALHHRVIPPTIKVQQPQPEVVSGGSPFYLATDKRPWLTPAGTPRRAGVSAFGFGGSNFHVVLEEYRPEKEQTGWNGDVQIISFSGPDAAAVGAALEAVPAEASWQAIRDLACASRQKFNPADSCRLVLVAERSRANLGAVKKNAQAMLAKNGTGSWQTPDGAYYATGAKPGKIGMLFPGQGSQYTGMLRDLACTFPELIDTLAAANLGFEHPEGAQLSDLIYPPSAFDAETRTNQEAELRATRVAQPAIGAVSLGALKVLAGFGVAPEAVAGHSYGELTALCAAGRIEEPVLHELSRLRGSLMSRGKGGMLAVSAELAAVEAVLAEEKLDLVIANRNAPTQSVLSGKTEEITRAAAVFKARGLTCKELPVAAAFHSELVADAAAPFGAALKKVPLRESAIPVYANSSADLYPAAPAEAKALLADQLARPVHFVAEIEAMYAAGVRTFVEVGPGARLTGLVQAILSGRDHVALAVDASSGKRSGVADLARTLAQLSVLGFELRLTAWDADYRPAPPSAKKPLMTIPLCGANYVKPRPKKPAASPVQRMAAQAPAAQATVAPIAPAAPAAPISAASANPVGAPFQARSTAAAPAAAVATPSVFAAPASPDALTASLNATRESMALLQKMQEDTAKLHLRFLEGQEAASNTLRALIEQQRLAAGGFAIPAPMPAAAPSPEAPIIAAPAAPVAAAPAPAPVAAAPAAPASNQVVDTLLTVISEKTGYPLEMLELDMGMDADLGIDSIKRVEILSALQERLPGSPVIGPEHLGSLTTLGQIADFLGAGSATAAASAPAAATTAPATATAAPVVETLLTVISEKTGYPMEMLELDMGMDSDLGIDSIKRVEILSALQERLPGAPIIGPEHLGTLATLGDIAKHLSAGMTVEAAPATPATAASAVTAPAAQAPAGSAAEITATLLAVVSEKTGYPTEMLELSMGMDSDLGIDSIKRVEILSALQERLPGSPAIGPEHLGTLATLGDIAGHLAAGASAPVSAPTAAATHPAVPAANQADVAAVLLEVVSEKTGYPTEMLELTMGMDSDLGIDSIKRVEILSALQERLPGSPTIGPEHLGTLATLGDIASHLSAGAASAPTAAPAPAAQAVPTAAPVAAASKIDVAAVLLEVVSEKTGYPTEMLELTMGMDSDLGIDSIKRVEILSALQERLPGAPTIGPEHLGTLATLGDIAAFLGGPASSAAPAVTAAATPVAEAPAAGAAPVAVAPPAPLPEPTGITRSAAVPVLLEEDPEAAELVLANEGEIWVTVDGAPFSAALCDILENHGCNVRRIDPATDANVAPSGAMSGLVVCAPEAGTDDAFLKNAFLLFKNAAAHLVKQEEGNSAVCVTISRLDGAFGFGTGAIADPLSGGLAGLAKTAAREWPEVACKAIDLASFPTPIEAAQNVVLEIFQGGPVEVALTPAGRYGLNLATLETAPAPTAAPVNEGDVVVITGGGRGVTAAAAVALAQSFHPTLVLLGRTPEPAAEPEWLSGLSQESEMKRAIMQNAPGKLHPREIEVRYRAALAARELRGTLAQIAATGAKAVYRSVDIRDTNAMTILLAGIRAEFGPIRGVVHGAGVLADRLIVDKTAEQFEEVYATKVAGLRALLCATADDPLRFIALFSSSTGRFGRVGQADYAVANEVLNKTAQAEARRREGCRAVSINWGPWDGGMVNAALKKIFAEEGVGVIDLAQGASFLVREIAATDAPVEIVAIASMEKGVVKKPAGDLQLSEAFGLNLTVMDYPFLRSHVLDGKAVLPMAVIVEWLAHGALHGNPGFRFHGFNDLRICKGVVFEEHTPFGVSVLAGRAVKRDSFFVVPVELASEGANGRRICHARAEIVLAGRLPEGIRSITEIPSTPYQPDDSLIYKTDRLFHGPDLHGIEKVDGCSAKGIAAAVKGAPAPGNWIKQPLRSSWLTDPLALDSAFQLMILWSFERFGSGSLPCFAGKYRQFQDTFPKEGVQVVVRVTGESAHGATADMEFLDRNTGKLVARLEDYECVIDPSLQQAFRRNRLSVAVGAA
ncbi:type I polyketide synthase [Geomesophilobacter sediminis]|uniref:SDR family NAD(P)-dependent oxidoreductase n=1 Tax=Geomesophilobacter sediminis TaxID=2798584 RepID=A0A8J7LWV0_9BACT|nr:type I polyketide synthase [Geomesophilobacter sediminis]MBJ6726280.1 SDR family NAD(P)-dependent oxidoreductase [Geomesophilobacter sediminis]